jgi:hypothetical protein
MILNRQAGIQVLRFECTLIVLDTYLRINWPNSNEAYCLPEYDVVKPGP